MNKNRARLYGRYSSTNQREESIEGQFRECQEYAARNGLVITGEYADRALSGKFSESRAQFLRMIKDAEKGLFDVLLVYKMDRFARNRYDAAVFKYKLRKAGVKVISVREHIPEGAEGIILESVLDGYAEYFSANLAENVRRGCYENAIAGKFNGGRVPYGYKIQDGEYVIDEAHAEIVREIYKRFAAGESQPEIFNSLNARGLRTNQGKPFSRGTIFSILHNEKYVGQFVYNTGDGEAITIDGGCPAIVSNELWNAVERRKKAIKDKPRLGKGAIKYALSGKIVCGECGGHYAGYSTNVRGTRYTYYRHNSRDYEHCVKRESIDKEWIENKVFMAIKERVLTHEAIEEITAAADALQHEEQDTSECAYKAEIAEVNAAIENIYKAIEQGIFSDGLKARLDGLEKRSAELALSIAGAFRSECFLEPNLIREYLMQFVNGDVEDESFRELVMSTFVKRIELKDGAVRVFLHYANDTELETICFDFSNIGLASVSKVKHVQDSGIVLFT